MAGAPGIDEGLVSSTDNPAAFGQESLLPVNHDQAMTEVQDQARELFKRLLLDGTDLISAQEARTEYVKWNSRIWCNGCATLKMRSDFDTTCRGTSIEQYLSPCKECRKKLQRDRMRRYREALKGQVVPAQCTVNP